MKVIYDAFVVVLGQMTYCDSDRSSPFDPNQYLSTAVSIMVDVEHVSTSSTTIVPLERVTQGVQAVPILVYISRRQAW